MPFFRKPFRPSLLPAEVLPVDDALVMRSDDINLLNRLKADLLALSLVEQGLVLACLYEQEVMRLIFLDFAARRWMKKLGVSKYHAYARMFHTERGFKAMHSLMTMLTTHMLTGHDREERFSIGGFSTRELQYIANVVVIIRRSVEEWACARLEAEQTDALAA